MQLAGPEFRPRLSAATFHQIGVVAHRFFITLTRGGKVGSFHPSEGPECRTWTALPPWTSHRLLGLHMKTCLGAVDLSSQGAGTTNSGCHLSDGATPPLGISFLLPRNVRGWRTPVRLRALLRAWVYCTHGLYMNPLCRRGLALWRTANASAHRWACPERASDLLLIAHVDNRRRLAMCVFVRR
jgi:hypothetical protein